MTRHFLTAAAAILLSLASTTRAQTAPATPPTADELRILLKEGKAQDALRGVTRALNLRGDAAAAYNRYELYVIRAEAMLATKQISGAVDALALARKEAKTPAEAAGAQALATLIQRSPGAQYKPKPPKAEPGKPRPPVPAPIPIIEQDSRKRAMEALYMDDLAAVLEKTSKLSDVKTLPPLAELAKQLVTLHALELAATEKDEQTTALQKQIGKHAAELIAGGIAADAKTITTLEAHANEKVERVRDVPTRTSSGTNNVRTIETIKRGLDARAQQTLAKIVDNSRKMTQAAEDFAAACPGAKDELAAVAEKAKALEAKVIEVMKADYDTPLDSKRF